MADNKFKNEISDVLKKAFRLKDVPAGKPRNDAEEAYSNLAEGLASSVENYTKRTLDATEGSGANGVQGLQGIPGSASGISDGDYTDATISADGTVLTINAGVVTNAKQANMAASTIKGNNAVGEGAPIDLSIAQVKSLLTIGNVENTALSTWAGTTSVTTLGTVSTGVWSGTAIGATKGGTAQTTWAAGDILYASATDTLAKLTGGENTKTPGLFLKTRSTTAAPYWSGPQGFGDVPTTTGTAQGPSSESADADKGVTVTFTGTSLTNSSRLQSLAIPYCHACQYTEVAATGSPVGVGVFSGGGNATEPATILAREPGGQWQLWTDNGAPGVPARDGGLINLPDYACVMVVVEATTGAKWYGSNSGEPGTWVLLASKTLTVPAYSFLAGIGGSTMTVNRRMTGTGATAYHAQLIPYTTINNSGAATNNVLMYYTAPYTLAAQIVTAAGRALMDDADATAQKTTLGLASVATSASAADLSTGTLLAARMPALTGDVTSTVGTVATTVVAASDTVAGKIEIAVQAEMEAGTDNTRCVSPAVQQYHPSSAKAWLYSIVNATVPANSLSYNLTSITDRGVGYLGITIATDFSTGSWAGVATVQHVATTYAVANDRKVSEYFNTRTATYIEYQCLDGTATTLLTKDPTSWSFIAFGDQ